MFFPPRYIVRVIKSILYISLFFFVIITIMYLFSQHSRPGLTIFDLIPNQKALVGFFIVYGLVYPLVAFIRKEVWLIKPFTEERADIIRVFDVVGYELDSDTDGIMRFRLKNRFYRFMRLFYEDAIEVDHTAENPAIITGLRKDAYRIARHIELMNRRDEDMS